MKDRLTPDEDPSSTERALASLWTWGCLAGTAIGGFGLQLPLALATLPFDRRRRLVGRFYHQLGVTVARLNPLWDFRLHGELPHYIPTRTVVVSNHVSNSDAFLISFLPWEMKWLGKASLFKIPFVGWGMWLAGDIPVVRGARDSIHDAMARCRDYLEMGMPVMIFPEGTRSKDGALLPFKDGAFRLAIEAQADVLPIAVAGTRRALPKHSWLFGKARAHVTVGQPISTRGMTLDDVDLLKATARAQIERLAASLESLSSD